MRRYIPYALIALITLLACSYLLFGVPGHHPTLASLSLFPFASLSVFPSNTMASSFVLRQSYIAILGGPYIYDWSCGSQNIYTYPLIDLRGFDGLNPELREWSRNIGGIDSKGQGLEADVIVTGIFDKSYSDPSDDSFSHRFRIIPTRIEQFSALRRRQ